MTSPKRASLANIILRWPLAPTIALGGGIFASGFGLAAAATDSAPIVQERQGRSTKELPARELSDGIPAEGATPEGSAPAGSDLESLLASIATSPRSMQFAADLEALITNSDIEGARRLLMEAIEVGTLAALMEGKLEWPELIASLKTMRKDPAQATATSQPMAQGESTAVRLEHLQTLLEQEREHSSAASEERDAIRAELQHYKAESTRRDAEQRAISERREEELEAALRDRDAIMAEVAALRQSDAEWSRKQEEFLLTKKRADAADEELTTLRQQIALLRAESSRSAAFSETAAAERARADVASAALEVHQRALDAREEKLAEVQSALEQERGRVEAATRERDALRSAAAELRAAHGEVETLRGRLAQEEQRAAAALAELSDVRGQNAKLRNLEAQLASVNAALEREQQRAEAGAAELALLKAQGAKQIATSSGAETRQGPPREEQGRAMLNPRSAAGEVLNPAWNMPLTVPARLSGAGPSPPADAASAEEPPSPPGTSSINPLATAPPASLPDPAQRLVTRADELLSARDITGARLLLERAAQLGSHRALFMLAQTYDPQMLKQWSIVGGISANEAKARELYASARAKGYRAEERP